MNTCAITPQVRNTRTNAVEDSRLYKDLLASAVNRRSAIDLYLQTKNPEFEHLGKKFEKDVRDEPLLNSLKKHTDIGNFLVKDGVLDKLELDLKSFKKTKKGKSRITYSGDLNTKDALTERVRNFNEHSEYSDSYVATYKRVNQLDPNNTGLQIEVTEKADLDTRAQELAFNNELDVAMRSILTSHGVSIGSLTHLEERMSINGVTDFSTAKRTAEGFIELIRLREGKEGSEALPEEFSHWAIEAHSDKPLIQRLINSIKDEAQIKEILGSEYEGYYALYQGNLDRLAREAAGKLLADAFKNLPPKNLKSTSLVSRIKDFVINLFPSSMAEALTSVLYTTTQRFNKLAASIMANPEALSNDNIQVKDSLYQRSKNEIVSLEAMFKKMIENEEKRLQIYKSKYKTEKSRLNQVTFISELQAKLEADTIALGITQYLHRAYTQIQDIDAKLNTLDSLSSEEKISLLENSRKYISSYKYIAGIFLTNAAKAEFDTDIETYPENVVSAMRDFNTQINALDVRVKAASHVLATEVLDAAIPASMTVSDTDPTPITGEWLLSDDKVDVGFLSRWLNSAANSSNHVINIIDNMLKKARSLARKATLKDKQLLQKAQMALEKAGIKNTAWMLEVDDEGNKTGYYIRAYNKGLFEKRRREELTRLKEKYNIEEKEGFQQVKKLYRIWIAANTEKVNGVTIPRITPKNGISYANPVYNNLNEAQKEYYELILAMKESAESKINTRKPGEAKYKIVAIKTDTLENIINNPKDIAKHLKQAVNDTISRVEDEDTFGVSQVLTDMEDGEVELLPVYYQSFNGNNKALQQASVDVTETMALYMNMANTYYHLDKVADSIELVRHAYGETNTIKTNAGQLINKLKSKARGEEQQESEFVYFKTKNSNAYAHLNDLISSQLYGKFKVKGNDYQIGNFKVSMDKVTDLLINLTSKNALMFNYLSETASVTQGVIAANVEAKGARFFKVSELNKADMLYADSLVGLLGDFGSRAKQSKLGLFLEKFNVILDDAASLRNINSEVKSKLGRLSKLETLSFIRNCGEHWMYARTALATAQRIKVKVNGVETYLYDALVVEPLDPSNPKAGNRIVYKEGTTTLTGAPISDDFEFAFEEKVHAINHELHGIYNSADKNAFQRKAVGRLVMLFRGWMIPAYLRRFGSAKFNMSLDTHTKGYYRSMGNFSMTLMQDLAKMEVHWVNRYNELTPIEQSNVRMAIRELIHFIALSLAVAFVEFPDEKSRHWLYKYSEYILYRTHMELAAMIPLPTILQEAGRLVKSPTAAVSTLETLLSLFDLLDPRSYMKIMKSGRYKGDTEAYKLFMNAVPFSKTINKVSNPDTLMPYFNQ